MIPCRTLIYNCCKKREYFLSLEIRGLWTKFALAVIFFGFVTYPDNFGFVVYTQMHESEIKTSRFGQVSWDSSFWSTPLFSAYNSGNLYILIKREYFSFVLILACLRSNECAAKATWKSFSRWGLKCNKIEWGTKCNWTFGPRVLDWNKGSRCT